jgi:hypothetical protein
VIICNVTPGFEQPNLWTLTLQTHPPGRAVDSKQSGMLILMLGVL